MPRSVQTMYVLRKGATGSAVAGRITDESAAGPNMLIREGAVPVLGAEDVLGLVSARHTLSPPPVRGSARRTTADRAPAT
jgi:predicted Rossmann fold nucleotide-binding protein DprA/Smf involved in DNA uptake